MMLKYSLNLPKEAVAIEEAVRRVIDMGVSTGDIGGKATTAEVGDKITEVLIQILKA